MGGRRSRAEQVEENRAAVLAAARSVFLAKGYAGATLDAIAQEAGFTKGVVYSQFESKADLFLALLDRRIHERAAHNERVVAGMIGESGLFALLENFERDSRSEAAWTRLLIEFRVVAARDPELNRQYAERHARTIDLLADLLQQLHARGGLEPGVTVRTMAEFILAFGAGAALEHIADPNALALSEVSQMMSRAVGFSLTTAPAV
jgi:AcrR family transcriptional regulator